MFCFQCQEAAKNVGCETFGMCGKDKRTSDLQDLLVYVLKGIAVYEEKLKELGEKSEENYDFIMGALFATVTNVNFDEERFYPLIEEGLEKKENLRKRFLEIYKRKNGKNFDGQLHESALWKGERSSFLEKAREVGVLSTENEDVRSLRELLIYGIKGIAAYAHHAAVFGFRKEEIGDFAIEALASTTKQLSVDEMVNLVMKAGATAVTTMALLDEANTSAYGNPEITEVNLGVRNNPGILVSGHDLRDIAELLEQTQGTG
ncbi:MAG: hydroxylamine reductase, partial [Acidobacteria bacterium]|nr:hydroxylamine reductase [Acidobacteriota bacterium]